MVEKKWTLIVNKSIYSKMLPQFYQTCLQKYLSPSQLITLETLVWLLQTQKQVRLERLAALFPLPILYESRRRHIQRFLLLSQLSISLIWFPIVQRLLKEKIKPQTPLYVVLDRTQWKSNNLFVVAVVWHRRAIPMYWQILDKAGSSNLAEQQALLRPVLRLLKGYKLVVVGDREFRSVALASWLEQKNVAYVFRQKQNNYVQLPGKNYQPLSSIGLLPGMKWYLLGIKITKEKGFEGNIAAYWKRKYRGKQEKQGWYLLTNLSLKEALSAYKTRSGIEAMFRDCKSGGYNLEGTKASRERLTRLVLLIAIAYTCSVLKGSAIQSAKQQKYVGRLRKVKQLSTSNSRFWLGLYGQVWIIGMELLADLVEKLMKLTANKLPFFQRGLRAMSFVQQAF